MYSRSLKQKALTYMRSGVPASRVHEQLTGKGYALCYKTLMRWKVEAARPATKAKKAVCLPRC